MAEQEKCMQCHRPLTPDEIGLHKKMFNRASTRYFCLACMAAYWEVPEDILARKIEEFRAMGCTLFLPAKQQLLTL